MKQLISAIKITSLHRHPRSALRPVSAATFSSKLPSLDDDLQAIEP